MNEDYEIIIEIFKEEACELLSEAENSLLELEKAPGNKEAISAIFRAFHSIKGGGGMFGFNNITSFTHEIETVYEDIRNGKIIPDKELIDISLASCDVIREMIKAPHAEPDENARDILASLRKYLSQEKVVTKTPAESPKKAVTTEQESARMVTYRIRFRPFPGIFATGTNPVLLLNELRNLGECCMIAHTDEIPELDEIDAETCYTAWDVILTTSRGIDAIKDVFIFVESESELAIEIIDDSENPAENSDYKKLGEILIEKRDITQEDLESVLGERRLIGEVLIDKGLVEPACVQSALNEQEHVRQIRENRIRADVISNIKVPSDKLDKLVNLVGELVTVQARLSQTAAYREDTELSSIAEEVERLAAELRDNTMNIRLLPIGTTFSKFKRLVRDLSKELGKEVEMTTDGADTELDKTVIERLSDPLLHLIRNCIDHGIELPEVRESSGKQRKGTINLFARHSGPNVLIQVSDDGEGLDKDAILAKASERGSITAGQELSDDEIYSLIFSAGFSTTSNATKISGRGVGLDVVKRAVDFLRGSITIESRRGAGTTITLVLPLTLAIIEGLLVTIGEEYFVLPLSSVEECVELIQKEVSETRGRHILNVRGKAVPYIRLREQFSISGIPPAIEQIVIVKHGGDQVGLVVDNVIGGHQTVIKNLGWIYRSAEGISGATILGDGSVALILDIPKLLMCALNEETVSLNFKYNI
ncbi:MAG: chemotaxis protein CheA [Nitrospirae bacterium]|nr:chemotaxis protein CheA [Nitrospirota bacterium]